MLVVDNSSREMDGIIGRGSLYINRDGVLRDLNSRCARSDLTKVLICKRILDLEGDSGWEVVMSHHLPLLRRGEETIYPYGYEFVDAEYEKVSPSHIPYLISESNQEGIYASTIDDIIEKVGYKHADDVRECVSKGHKFTLLSPSMNEWVNRSIVQVHMAETMTPLLR